MNVYEKELEQKDERLLAAVTGHNRAMYQLVKASERGFEPTERARLYAQYIFSLYKIIQAERALGDKAKTELMGPGIIEGILYYILLAQVMPDTCKLTCEQITEFFSILHLMESDFEDFLKMGYRGFQLEDSEYGLN